MTNTEIKLLALIAQRPFSTHELSDKAFACSRITRAYMKNFVDKGWAVIVDRIKNPKGGRPMNVYGNPLEGKNQ